eukprot:2051904-Lingulodinium_polyedra.AAC.1
MNQSVCDQPIYQSVNKSRKQTIALAPAKPELGAGAPNQACRSRSSKESLSSRKAGKVGSKA